MLPTCISLGKVLNYCKKRMNSVLVARPRKPVGKPSIAAVIMKLIFLQLLQKGKTVCNPKPGSLNRILPIKQVYKVLEHGRHYYSDGLRALRRGGRVDVLISSKQGHESDSLMKAEMFGCVVIARLASHNFEYG